MSVEDLAFESVTLKKIRKVFGRYAALSNVNCEFRAGEVSLLMGPNGAGKSTLLTMLSTTSRPSSGEVFYGEQNHIQAEKDLRASIGLLSHAPLLYPELSAQENLSFFAKLYGKKNASAWVKDWLAHVDLEAAANRPIRLLSHGMKQRVALGRCLVGEPALLLLDEPFTGLDRSGIDLLRQEIIAAQKANRIIIIVTHDVEAVDGLCDHIVVLKRGRVVDDQRPGKLSASQILSTYQEAIR